MSDITLKQLRELRSRSKILLGYVTSDLKPFLNEDKVTFRRKPDSEFKLGDVNVTTTCSCLMALALTNKFDSFYKDHYFYKALPQDFPNKAQSIFEKLIGASWMSSGISENNAFTTSLILRTYGLLKKAKLLSEDFQKDWEIDLGLKRGKALAVFNKFRRQKTPAARFLWRSMGEQARSIEPTPSNKDKVRKALLSDLRRIVQGGWIYEHSRFPKLSKELKTLVADRPIGNNLVNLNRRLIAETFPQEFEAYHKRSLSDIGQLMASSISNFAINEYSPSAAVVYWFVDGIDRANIEIKASDWERLCRWAEEHFTHQRSITLAEHDAMMDPVAMAMSACLCARLRRISESTANKAAKDHLAHLPSLVELEHSIGELFKRQSISGIWPKYFPLFHYQDAGSNFCFTFELLEAVLTEFGHKDNHLLEDTAFLEGLTRAVSWCERNLLKYSVRESQKGRVAYRGWNSGGNLKTLEYEQPESWATAVVHMFLWELQEVLSRQIQNKVLKKYHAKPRKILESSEREAQLDNLMDVNVVLQNQEQSLIKLLKQTIIKACQDKEEADLRLKSISAYRSALLFGPPGTSKTQITKAIADSVGWPLIDINPSHFVRNGLDNVYLLADEIFEDLSDLSAVVVFFDEMDALVQSRAGDENNMDIVSQFLTTSMLPKLADLYSLGRVAFLMATNFQDRFDAAIKRAGRFDLLLCMGPPSLNEKLTKIHRFYDAKCDHKITRQIKKLIMGYLKDEVALRNSLELYTFGDFKSFISTIGTYKTLVGDLQLLEKKGFIDSATKFSEFVLLRLSDVPRLQDVPLGRVLKYDSATLKKSLIGAKKPSESELVRYLESRLDSRKQL
jgi:SpoVK/Ycf46/Vps4 family AAA+-type ATPase